jgi:hypothetical protein
LEGDWLSGQCASSKEVSNMVVSRKFQPEGEFQQRRAESGRVSSATRGKVNAGEGGALGTKSGQSGPPRGAGGGI